MENGTCRLCQQNKPLCHSHLIPESFYRPIYDPNHSMCLFNNQSDDRKILRKGLSERLFCESCESKVNREYEDYARKVWNGECRGGHANIKYHWESDRLEVEGLDYTRMKLFFMLVLWRIGVSDRFKEINLGRHEEILRRMIFNGDPGEVHDYGCLLVAGRRYEEVRSIMAKSIFVGQRSRLDGHSVYWFLIGGIVWHIFVSSHISGTKWCKTFLQLDGRMQVFQADDYVENLIRRVPVSIPSIHSFD